MLMPIRNTEMKGSLNLLHHQTAEMQLISLMEQRSMEGKSAWLKTEQEKAVGLEAAHAQEAGDDDPGVDLPVVADQGAAADPEAVVEAAEIRNQGANQSPRASQDQDLVLDPAQLTKIMEKMMTGGMMIRVFFGSVLSTYC